MKEDCLQLLAKLDKCIKDSDFQLILVMKFMRTLMPAIKDMTKEGEPDERNDTDE